jgi:hypothetical protein
MTLWELAACVDGYNAANGGDPAVEPPTEEELEDMMQRHAWVASHTQH